MERKRFTGNETSEECRDVPLRVVIVDGMLAIEIGLDTLKCVFENGPLAHEFKLLSVDQLAKEIAVILQTEEDEIGMTPIMHAIDNAIERAIVDGSVAVDQVSEGEPDDEREINQQLSGRWEK